MGTEAVADLTPKQERFVQEYLVDLNATQAAIRAGYSPKTAGQQGERLLKNVEVAAAVETAMQARSERSAVTQDYVLTNLREVVERCMQRAPVPEVDGQWRFDGRTATSALGLLGKHLGMFAEQVKVDAGPVEIVVTRVSSGHAQPSPAPRPAD